MVVQFSASMVSRDDSFKKPGSVPFKWEEKPGVPKSHLDHHRSLPTTPRRLTPPPSLDLGSQSFRSTTSVRSDQHQLEPKPRAQTLAHPLVVSVGCLLSPLFRRKWNKKKKVAHKSSPEHDPGYVVPGKSEANRRSTSTRRSMSSWEFPTFSSRTSSPRAVREPEWAGVGLF